MYLIKYLNLYNKQQMILELTEIYNKIKKLEKENLNDEFIKLSKEYDIEIIQFIFFQAHNFIFDENKFKIQLTRALQHKFRNDLIKLYNRCIITNVSNFEACHIIPFVDTDYHNRYDKYNGILLKPDLHVLFDKFIFSINPETFKVEFIETFFENSANKKEYKRFNNFKLNIQYNEKLQKNLKYHYTLFKNNM